MQLVDGEGFVEEHFDIGVGVGCTAIDGVERCGEDDDGHLLFDVAVLFFELGEKCEAVHVGHVNIEEYELRHFFVIGAEFVQVVEGILR